MVYPWVLFATEFSTVRFQDPFVLYRSYLWMSGLPAALPLLARNFPANLTTVLLSVLCFALLPPTAQRLRTFSSQFALWDDVVKKQSDETAYGTATAYAVRGQLYYDRGRLEESVRDFSKAIELSPERYTYYRGRGHCAGRAKAGTVGGARFPAGDRDRSRTTRKTTSAAAISTSFTRWNEAIADCDKAIALNPHSPRARHNRNLVDERLFACACSWMAFAHACVRTRTTRAPTSLKDWYCNRYRTPEPRMKASAIAANWATRSAVSKHAPRPTDGYCLIRFDLGCAICSREPSKMTGGNGELCSALMSSHAGCLFRHTADRTKFPTSDDRQLQGRARGAVHRTVLRRAGLRAYLPAAAAMREAPAASRAAMATYCSAIGRRISERPRTTPIPANPW